MVDRTDIDALLIGALYGELTPADEARLTAHLESHPADRTALDHLTRTRAAVRESRILAFQVDPPQAISALLLQEASRRAPRAATDRGEAMTWFQRVVRSFTAHPAMAAAATLMLVITAAGTLYLRGTDPFATSEPPPAAEQATIATATDTTGAAPSIAAAPAPPRPEPEAPGAPGDSTGTLAGASDGLASGSGVSPTRPTRPTRPAQPAQPAQFDSTGAARFDDTAAKGTAPEHQAAAPVRLHQEPGDGDTRASYERAKLASKAAQQDAELRKQGAATMAAPAKPDKAEAVRGIELRTPQLMPRDFKDSGDEKPAGGRASAGGALATPSVMASPPPPAAAPAAPRAAGPAGAGDFDMPPSQPPAQAGPASAAKRLTSRPSGNQLPAPPSASTATSAQAERRLDKTANAANADAKQAQADRTLLEWARKQREQVIAFVNANRCRDAASAAVEIYNRAPDYYNANIATDRQIRPCLAYVNDQRERADRSRANKNAADVQAPAQAAPVRK